MIGLILESSGFSWTMLLAVSVMGTLSAVVLGFWTQAHTVAIGSRGDSDTVQTRRIQNGRQEDRR
jgi:hypothetical protein